MPTLTAQTSNLLHIIYFIDFLVWKTRKNKWQWALLELLGSRPQTTSFCWEWQLGLFNQIQDPYQWNLAAEDLKFVIVCLHPSFLQTHRIGNNDNTGIRGFTTQKQRNPATKCHSNEYWTWNLNHSGLNALMSELLRHVLLGISLNCLLFLYAPLQSWT